MLSYKADWKIVLYAIVHCRVVGARRKANTSAAQARWRYSPLVQYVKWIVDVKRIFKTVDCQWYFLFFIINPIGNRFCVGFTYGLFLIFTANHENILQYHAIRHSCRELLQGVEIFGRCNREDLNKKNNSYA